MKRRDFLKTLLASGALYTTGGIPTLGRIASASGFPAQTNRVLVNIMLSGGPDLRHLMPPPFDPALSSYGYRFWESKAGAHSIDQTASAYQARWENDYFNVNDGTTEFGILRKCGWLKRMWDAGNVAIVANTVGGTTRNHRHCSLVMDQGNLASGPNDSERSGWGGRLASYTGGNVLALTTTPTHFSFGPHPTNIESHDNRNLISARNTRKMALYRGDNVPYYYPSALVPRSLNAYYKALNSEMDSNSIYYRFVEQNRLLREYGRPVEDRLSTIPLPDSIAAFIEGGLSSPELGQQIGNLYDSFACSDILSLRVASMEIKGWDSHRSQSDTIEPKLEDLFGDGMALDVLFQELPADAQDNTVFVIGGEFGRQLHANGDNGTDHGSGSCTIIIGNGVQGGVYGEMFPEEELTRLNMNSSEITGLTTIDSVYSAICDWAQPGAGNLVFPDQSLSTVETGVNLNSLFLPT